MSEGRKSPARWFAEEWTETLGTVLESLAGERPQLACRAGGAGLSLAAATADLGGRHGAIVWWQERLPLPGEPCLWIGAPQETLKQLAARVLGAAGVEDESQARETYIEVLQQSLGELSRSAAQRWDQKVDAAGHEVPAGPESAEFYLVEASYRDASPAPCLFAITGTPQDPPLHNAPAAADKTGEPLARSALPSKTFRLLMEVELPVSVSFGHVQLALKDVLKLTAGSIIELNRTVDEPVEVIVNNCVVARGEVVVVEGNYGVRIHEIMTRQERLETLP